MSNDPLFDKREEFLKSEKDQAWTHYRHIEETRTKYINFFFTMLIASIGFLLTFFKNDHGTVSGSFLFILSIFIFSIFLISIIILASIIRFGYVLSSYEIVLEETRKYFYGENSVFSKIWMIRNNIPDSVNNGIFSIQKSSIKLVSGACISFSLAEFYLSYKIHILCNCYLSAHTLSPLITGIVMLALFIYVMNKLSKAKKEGIKIRESIAKCE